MGEEVCICIISKSAIRTFSSQDGDDNDDDYKSDDSYECAGRSWKQNRKDFQVDKFALKSHNSLSVAKEKR